MIPNNLGQYFTTSIELKEKVLEFIMNDPFIILEPSIGRGDLVAFITNKLPDVVFDMYEIDSNIKVLEGIQEDEIIYGDFLTQRITARYKTIIGNPPYIRTKTGNVYINFIERCCNLLEDNGELIFIVPADFYKLTSAANVLEMMLREGTFTHIYHPHNEKLFDGASIDVVVFRYCKNSTLDNVVSYNGTMRKIINNNGMITFSEINVVTDIDSINRVFGDYFNIYVGMVTGKEEVYKHNELGNITMLNGKDQRDRYIYLTEFPSNNATINQYLLQHKSELIVRKIRKFGEHNWFEWGALRNLPAIRNNFGKDCIYIYNLTRKPEVAFIDKVQYFGGGLIMMLPKKEIYGDHCMKELEKIVAYINSAEFKSNFMFSGRFKIGQRQLCYSMYPHSAALI